MGIAQNSRVEGRTLPAGVCAKSLRNRARPRGMRWPCWLVLRSRPPRPRAQLKIQKFSAEIFVQPDSALDVTETIEANFIGAWHGLYRSIPIEYVTPQGFNYTLFVKLEERDRRRRAAR